MTPISPELPINLPAEEAALGAALYRPDAVGLLAGIVRQPNDFYLAKHQLVYQAMLDLHIPPLDFLEVFCYTRLSQARYF